MNDELVLPDFKSRLIIQSQHTLTHLTLSLFRSLYHALYQFFSSTRPLSPVTDYHYYFILHAQMICKANDDDGLHAYEHMVFINECCGTRTSR